MNTLERSFFDRRSGKDRRRKLKLDYFFYRGQDRRDLTNRRTKSERREAWVRVSKWSSVCLRDIKLSKYLG